MDDGDFQLVVDVLDAVLHCLERARAAHMNLELFRIRRRGRVDDLDFSLVIGIRMPLRAQRHDLGVEARRNGTRGGDNHGFARCTDEFPHVFAAVFPVANKVLSERIQAVVGTVNDFQRGDGALNPVALHLVETREHFLGRVINIVIRDSSNALEWDEARLEVDGYHGAVLDGAVHVVDIHVVTEDLARVAVPFLERGTGKCQHGGIR